MRNLIYLLLTLAMVSCKTKQPFEIERAFYKWNDRGIYTNDVEVWQALQVKKIYHKFFEVDYSPVRGNFPYDKNRPYYDLNFAQSDISLIPVIFIRNEIFSFNDEKSLDKLADDIAFLTNKYTKREYDERVIQYDEIQIDCDWTKGNREKYFYLLKKIKEKSGKKISCTLRLYAYAYPDVMGVPPVDKVMLMCYNLIKPLSDHKRNSILDIDELKKYVTPKKYYPVQMDVAMPAFYWSLLFQNNEFEGTMNIACSELKSFTKDVEPFWFEVTKDTLISYEKFVMEGDRIKCEEVSHEQILEALDVVTGIIKKEGVLTVALFDWDESTLKQYSLEELDAIYARLLP